MENTFNSVEETFKSDFVVSIKRAIESYDYKLNYCWRSKKTGYIRLSFSPRTYLMEKGYVIKYFDPDIYISEEDDHSLTFSMQTTSYGALHDEELTEFMRKINNAYSLISFLNSIPWSKCPVVDDTKKQKEVTK